MATVASHPTCVPRGGARASLRRTATTRGLRARVSARRSRVAVVPRASEVDDALQFGTAITDYVPSPMDTSALQSQGVVLLTVGVMTAYWWYVLVPGARVNLAVNKRTGKLRDYLVANGREKTLRADPECSMLFAEIDNKSYAPGYKEKPLIKALREVTLRGPAMSADVNKYVVVDATSGAARAAIPKINGKTVKNVKTLMDEYHDPFPVWIM